ncbi:hypothetical protein [Vibrio aestuarianus]|uniref:hypothetical protein n=1 Tax=Vibrio aestuarianus TaxID=28171 RepID=UPI0014470FFC|nr:hypothetical protein [Vibrio aestuarianus]MDE1213474.1 hypothetical protein [Vibrio aestuarianus]MDE1219134.1 hypothetical protein [Vibrio aestuarianus]MDE1260247.1 hypothetical protein [Vibrio aestuarianus]MDE1266821.1 hypothetical protein [Vibrio aestuarianus]MDE1275205.1 hypothetical protein [Vibrio aestuarianus]
MRLSIISLAVMTSLTHASELCRVDDEVTLLDNSDYRALQQENYASYSRDLVSGEELLSSPGMELSLKGKLPNELDLFAETSGKLTTGPTSALTLTETESTNILRAIGRPAEEIAAGPLEALGPVGDALAVGLWAMDVANTFEDESRTAYDRFASVLSIVDVFGVLRIPQRAIDRQIIANRWDSIASGDHYSYTIHQDLATEQDQLDKELWGSYAKGYHQFLERSTLDYMTDVAMKYQLHYQELVHGQTQLAQELINGIDQAIYASLMSHLAPDTHNGRVLLSEMRSHCHTENATLFALFTPDTAVSNNNRPSRNSVSEWDINRAYGRLQVCQTELLGHITSRLKAFTQGELSGFDQDHIRQALTHTLAAKKKIVTTTLATLEQNKTRIIHEMHEEGLGAINRLFDSNSVQQVYQFIKTQARRAAIDEIVRSELYRPATAAELASGTIILKKAYKTCSPRGLLGMSCTTTPAVIRQFHDGQDEVVRAIVPRDRAQYVAMFDAHLDRLIRNGGFAEYHEDWLSSIVADYQRERHDLAEARNLKAEVQRWLFGDVSGDCTGNCARWNAGYLTKFGVHPNASLHTINKWLAAEYPRISGRTRAGKLIQLVPQAIAAEWNAKGWQKYRYFAHPRSVDLRAQSPKVYKALEFAIQHGSTTNEQLVHAAKRAMTGAYQTAHEQPPGWLEHQFGDLYRYIAIARLQRKTTGHSGQDPTTHLFSETLPGHLVRFASDAPAQNLTTALNSWLQPANTSHWTVEYDRHTTPPLTITPPTQQALSEEPVVQQISALDSAMQTYSNHAMQQRSIPLRYALDYTPLQSWVKDLSSNPSVIAVPFMSQWFEEVDAYLGDVRFTQAKAKAKLEALNAPISGNR